MKSGLSWSLLSKQEVILLKVMGDIQMLTSLQLLVIGRESLKLMSDPLIEYQRLVNKMLMEVPSWVTTQIQITTLSI